MEHAQAALKSLIDAKQSLEAETEAVNAMQRAMQAATQNADDAAMHLRTADSYEESALRFAYTAQRALEQSVARLRELNRQSLHL
jgi:hypothetical protein